METHDFIVIGGGIAGASAASFLAERGRTLLLEREPQPGYHSTGRSAAIYSEAYGNAAIRALTTAARPFFMGPPPGFAEYPLLTERGAMFIGRADQAATLDRAAAETSVLQQSIRRIDAAEARRICPVLRADYVAGAVLEPEAMDIDVHALHQGFLRRLRAAGGRVATDAGATALSRRAGLWRVATTAGEVQGRIVVNAAGAWADEVARLAGAEPAGLVPKRRTAILFAPPPGLPVERWPLVLDIDETFYFKPDAGKLLGSPADETPVPPCDVQPEELEVALAAERIQQAADLPIARIERRWAGLRTFAPDKTPVVGFDPQVEGFFWLGGQGGYGIQTAPALGRLAAALASGRDVPAEFAALGVDAAALSPGRAALKIR